MGIAKSRATDRAASVAATPFYRSDFHLAHPPGVPAQVNWDILESSLEVERRETSAAQGYQTGADRANREYLSQLYSAIGGDVAEYLAFRRSSIEELRAAKRRLKSPRERREIAKLRRAQADRSVAFVKNHGIDMHPFRQSQKQFQKGRDALIDTTLGRDEVEASPRRTTKNQDHNPPFDGWSWALSQYTYNGDADSSVHFGGLPTLPTADPQTGRVGHVSLIGVENASDCDEFNVACRAAVIECFQIPQPGGNVRVRILAKIDLSYHAGHIEPEFFDTSSVYVRQRMRFYARVLSPSLGWSPSITWPVFNHGDEDIDDHSWNNDSWAGGVSPGIERNFGPAIVPGSYSPGTLVAVEAGILHRNRIVTDDCTVNSSVSTSVLIKELGLSVAEFGDL